MVDSMRYFVAGEMRQMPRPLRDMTHFLRNACRSAQHNRLAPKKPGHAFARARRGSASALIAGLCWLLCLCLGLPVMAGDRITERAYLEDPGGQLGWEEAREREFHPFQGILSRGYTQSAVWLKLLLEPGDPDPSGWFVLRIRPNHLDEVRLFDPGQAPADRVTGDLYPGSLEAYRSLNLNFLIPQGQAPRTVWLRIRTTGTLLALAEAYPLAEALVIDNTQDILMVLYIATLGFFSFWSGFHAWVSRDLLFGVFALKQGLALLAMIVIAGYYRLYFAGSAGVPSASLLSDLCLPPVVSAGIAFDYLLIRPQKPNRAVLRLLLALSLLPLPYYALYAMGRPQTAFMLLQMIVGFWPLLSLMADFTMPRRDNRPAHIRPVLNRRQLILFHGLIVLALSISILPNLGLAVPSAWVFDGYLFYNVFTGGIILILLHYRLMRQNQQRFARKQALREAETQRDWERAQRRQREQFLAMLTHEIRTPLTVLNLVLENPASAVDLLDQGQDAVKDIGGIIDRCQFTDRLENGQIALCRQSCELAELIADVTRRSPDPHRIRVDDAGVPPIDTDPQLLAVILGNLIDNASKYGDERQPIEIRLERAAHDVVPGVAIWAINGPSAAGWPEAGRVFAKFYRTPGAHLQTGSGLGLYLAKGLAETLGGQLEYRPTADTIRFRLWLPHSVSS